MTRNRKTEISPTMKRILLSLSLLLTTMAAMAQVPQGINYQAVMRYPSES